MSSCANIGGLTLPLTYFDLFYKLPIAKTYYIQTIIPSLKHSLSLALQHYMILAGNNVCPLNSTELHHVIEDCVLVTFFESDMNFDFLIGKHLRKAKDVYHLLPKFAECRNAPVAALLAIQVTLFPNHGISIGFTNHLVGFIRAWAFVMTDDNLMKFFGCAGNCRARFNPPLPQSYFGNCLVGYIARASHVDLAGKQGFTIAVELIGEAIQKRMKDEEWVLSGSWIKEIENVDMSRMFSIAGSPKLDLYAADFGWGRATKLEFISIDNDEGISMSLSKSKDFDGDLEIGLSLSKTQMNAFAAIFTHGLNFLYQVCVEEG